MENNDIKNAVTESSISEMVEESRHSGVIPLAFLGGAVLISGAVFAVKLIKKKMHMHKISENDILDEVVIENDDDNCEI